MEKLLYQNAARARDLWLETAQPDDLGPAHPFSAAFQEKMTPLLRRGRFALWRRWLQGNAQRLAAASMLLVALLSSGRLNVAAMGASLIDAFAAGFAQATQWIVPVQTPSAGLTLSYLPPNMTQIGFSQRENFCCLRLEDNNGGYLRVTRIALEEALRRLPGQSAKAGEMEYFELGDETQAGDVTRTHNTVVWVWGNYIYSVSGNLPLSQLRAVAQGIE